MTSRSARSRPTSPRRTRAAPTPTASTPAASATSAARSPTLGDLVADALRDGIPAAQGKADIGIVNPGGLRAELLYAGEPAANPANTDGVVTYAEANNVLPFVNNIWLVQLTGGPAQGRARAAVAAVGSRPPVPAPGPVRQRPGHPEAGQPGRQADHRRCWSTGCKTQPKQDLHGQHVQLPRHRAATTSPRSRPARPRTPVWWTATCGSATSRARARSRRTSPGSRPR